MNISIENKGETEFAHIFQSLMSNSLAEIVFWTRAVDFLLFFSHRNMCTEHSMVTERIMNKNHVRAKGSKRRQSHCRVQSNAHDDSFAEVLSLLLCFF